MHGHDRAGENTSLQGLIAILSALRLLCQRVDPRATHEFILSSAFW